MKTVHYPALTYPTINGVINGVGYVTHTGGLTIYTK